MTRCHEMVSDLGNESIPKISLEFQNPAALVAVALESIVSAILDPLLPQVTRSKATKQVSVWLQYGEALHGYFPFVLEVLTYPMNFPHRAQNMAGPL